MSGGKRGGNGSRIGKKRINNTGGTNPKLDTIENIHDKNTKSEFILRRSPQYGDKLHHYHFHLTQVSLEDNYLDSLDGFSQLENVVELYLSYNLFEELRSILALKNCSKLTILDLAGNPLCNTNERRNNFSNDGGGLNGGESGRRGNASGGRKLISGGGSKALHRNKSRTNTDSRSGANNVSNSVNEYRNYLIWHLKKLCVLDGVLYML